ncbi:MAG: flexitail domain-containing putative surface protein [Candidatus Woykebacteria bacterium]
MQGTILSLVAGPFKAFSGGIRLAAFITAVIAFALTFQGQGQANGQSPTPTETPPVQEEDLGSQTVPIEKLLPDLDIDNDGCTNEEELGPNPALGGRRDPINASDFFDTPPRDNTVSAADISRVVARFGTHEGSPGYWPDFDRSAPPPGGDPWDSGPPDGIVAAADIGLIVFQFGHRCEQIEYCGGKIYDLGVAETVDSEIESGEKWRDCYYITDAGGRIVSYEYRQMDASQGEEPLTEAEVEALRLESSNLQPVPQAFRSLYCQKTYRWYNPVGLNNGTFYLKQRFVITTYSNIVWEPPAAIATADAAWGWEVDQDPQYSTNPIAWYRGGAVAVGETEAWTRFKYRIEAFGIGFSFRTITARITLHFKYNLCSWWVRP